MDRKRFLESRRDKWLEFQALLESLERVRGPRLSSDQVSTYSQLFRALCYDLSTTRSRQWGNDIELYLNDLVTRGHNAFYGARPRRAREFLTFLSRGFPRLLRENHRYFWLALVLFLVPGIVAGITIAVDPELVSYVLPHSALQQFDDMYSGAGRDEAEALHSQEATMAGFYVYNNIGIAFRCFATGIFFGVGTVFYLVYNSVYLGVVTSYVMILGHSSNFFSFVVSHGSFELTAIVIAGAAGLMLGNALLRPGPYRRMDALRLRARSAVQIAAGAGVMLAIAAIIESFWSPSALPISIKYTGGAFFWLLTVAYLTLAGRRSADA